MGAQKFLNYFVALVTTTLCHIKSQFIILNIKIAIHILIVEYFLEIQCFVRS